MKIRFQRMAACLTLCALLFGLGAAPASAAGFQDVPAGHWAAESIQRCVSLGFFQGKSADRFGLGEDMTRSAFAVVLCRFFGWEAESSGRTVFQDVPADAWYAGAVEAAYDHGAVTDQRDDFRPNDPITREELAVMLVRALGYGTMAGLVQDLEMPFTDVTTNAGYVTMAYDLGLMSGTTGTTFAPDETATREQVAVILMRLYDKLHGAALETLAVVTAPAAGEELADMTGLDEAAIPAGRLIGVGNQPSVTATIPQETAAQMRDAARAAGAEALLYVEGGVSALDADLAETAAVLAQAVSDDGYDGLILDIPQLDRTDRRAMTQLAQELDEVLADTPLYLVVEAPAWAGKSYDGYDYAALAQEADRLILRIGSYENLVGDFPTAPVNPLEEIYYTLATLRDQVGMDQLTLMLDTAPTVWNTRGQQVTLSEEELTELLASGEQHYSSRYACAYLIGADENENALVAWYLTQQSAQERIQLAQAFGVGQLCLADWNATVQGWFADTETE